MWEGPAGPNEVALKTIAADRPLPQEVSGLTQVGFVREANFVSETNVVGGANFVSEANVVGGAYWPRWVGAHTIAADRPLPQGLSLPYTFSINLPVFSPV